MATDVIMPQMGESIAEGTITRWLVKVGDKMIKSIVASAKASVTFGNSGSSARMNMMMISEQKMEMIINGSRR